MIGSAMLLSACTAQPGSGGTATAVDANDVCRPQVEQFDSNAAYFAAPIVAGAAVVGAGGVLGTRPGVFGALVWAASSAAAAAVATSYIESRQQQAAGDADALARVVATDVEQENAKIAQTRQALDSVTDCRLREARRLQEAARAGAIQRQEAAARLATLRQEAERDLATSRQVQQRIEARATEIGTGVDVVAPGARTAPPPPPRPVATRPAQPVPLQAAPLPAAARVAEVPARQPVQIVPTRNADFVAVQTPTGQPLGYAPAAVFSIPPSQTRGISAPAAAAATDSARVRTLVATNIARRENFTESVNDLQRAVSGGGFELGT